MALRKLQYKGKVKYFFISFNWDSFFHSFHRFRCIKCIKAGVSEHDATWSSAYTTVLFRAYYGPDTDEDGQIWIGGWIQMKIFAQQCQNCDEYVTPELDNERPRCLVRWLHRWIANKFYGFPFSGSYYRGKETNLNHLQDRCEACQTGWCYYLRVESTYADRRRNWKKGNTISFSFITFLINLSENYTSNLSMFHSIRIQMQLLFYYFYKAVAKFLW
jgi:hypothetical protein